MMCQSTNLLVINLALGLLATHNFQSCHQTRKVLSM